MPPLLVLAAVATLRTTPSCAQSIEEKTQVCAGCHGADGKPVDKTIPTIWGQQAGYIYIELRDFKRGDRKSDIMQPIVASFEREDMLEIAEYFSKKPWPDLGQPRAPKDVADAGRRPPTARSAAPAAISIIFRATARCRGWRARAGNIWPRHMTDFRSRARGNNPGMSDLMLATAPDDLAALAEYLAGLAVSGISPIMRATRSKSCG